MKPTTEAGRSKIPNRIKWHARFELLAWLCLLVPDVGFFLLLFPFILGEASPASFGMVLLVPVLIVAALPVDYILGLSRPPYTRLPKEAAQWIELSLMSLAERGAVRLSVKRVSVISGDLSAGAHVEGAVVPKIVISAGMAIGLRRSDSRCESILAHELAHIGHLDRFFLAIISIGLIGMGQSLWLAVAQTNLILLFAPLVKVIIISNISRRREFAADASAAYVVGKELYVDFLNSSSGPHTKQSPTFFHPSVYQRINAIESNSFSQPSLMLFFAYACYLAVALTQEFYHAIGMVLLVTMAMVLEFSRWALPGFVRRRALP